MKVIKWKDESIGMAELANVFVLDTGSNLGTDKIFSDSFSVQFKFKFEWRYFLSIIC